MNELESIIRARIKEHGPMSFRDLMQAALYEPGLGYYTRPETEIGRKGDFYTSPHTHRIFGAMIARQAMEMRELMGGPESFDIVEFGGGRGWLAKDILDHLSEHGGLKGIGYTLVELNPVMRERQEDLLRAYEGIVRWASTASGCGDVRGMVLSNELIDAMPVHLVEFRQGWQEVFILLDADELRETLMPLSSEELSAYLEMYAPSPGDGMRTEVNLGARTWLREVSGMLREGFVLTIDYGYPASDYYDPERSTGTLLCYHGHRTSEDYMANIGEQDITAHVNFTDMRQHGEELGLRALGFARQGPYLVSLGIDEVFAAMLGQDAGREAHLIHNLIMPGTMGDTHKVLIQCRGDGEPELRGFRMKNELGKLG